MRRYIWWALPVAAVWISVYLDHLFIDGANLGWWFFPMIVTEATAFIASLVVAMKKADGQ